MAVASAVLREVRPPFFLLDLPRVSEKFGMLRAAFSERFPRLTIAVSYKTNYLPAMLRRLHDLGADAEVVSEVEYELAVRLGVEGGRIIFNGPGKSEGALSRALSAGATVNLDSLEEVAIVERLWRRGAPGPGRVGLRVSTALPDHDPPGAQSRFGLDASGEDLPRAVAQLRAAGVSIAGLHAHLTSRARRREYYRALAQQAVHAASRAGITQLEYLDLGGGFGFGHPAMPARQFPSFREYAAALREGLQGAPFSIDDTQLVIEPGIALCGDCLSAACSVIATKQIGGRTLCVVDASVQTVKPTKHAVNLPTVAYDASHAPKGGPLRRYDVVGYTCLEDDVIARDLELPEVATGDTLVIDNVGAYTFVFKPAFIRGMPAFYAWDGRGCSRVRRPDDFADMFGAYVL